MPASMRRREDPLAAGVRRIQADMKAKRRRPKAAKKRKGYFRL